VHPGPPGWDALADKVADIAWRCSVVRDTRWD